MRTLYRDTDTHSPSHCLVGALQTPQSPHREHWFDQATFPCSSQPTQLLPPGAGCQQWSHAAGKVSQTVVQIWLHSDAVTSQILLLEGAKASCQAQPLPSQKKHAVGNVQGKHTSPREKIVQKWRVQGKKKKEKNKKQPSASLNSQEAITALQV